MEKVKLDTHRHKNTAGFLFLMDKQMHNIQQIYWLSQEMTK